MQEKEAPTTKKRKSPHCGRGGIGRLIGFRFQRESVQVRVLSPAPYRVFITDLTVVSTRFFFSVRGIATAQSDAR